MRRRLRGLSERNWRVIDRLLVVFLVAITVLDLTTGSDSTGSHLRGPLALNLAVMILIALSFAFRRSRPAVTVAFTLVGLTVMSIWLTQPPDLFVAVLMLVTVAYSSGRHLAGRVSVYLLVAGSVAMVTLAAIYDPNDIFFPVSFFWIVPWLAGRTIRNHTMLARELAEKAERAQHAREEDERRAIALERSRIARELHDVLAHNLSVMVVQASAARRVVHRNPDKAVEVAALIERTGREALAEIRHLFGAVRRGDGEDLSGPPSIARVGELAQRARAAGLGVELRVVGEPVPLPTGIDLTAYRIVQEALTNALKHAGSARACVTVSYEPNEVVLSIEDDGEGPRDGYELSEAGGGHGLVGMRERAVLYGGRVQAGRRRGGGFAVHARLPTRPALPDAGPATAVREVPA
jgi:signal transduction histidine kinase